MEPAQPVQSSSETSTDITSEIAAQKPKKKHSLSKGLLIFFILTLLTIIIANIILFIRLLQANNQQEPSSTVKVTPSQTIMTPYPSQSAVPLTTYRNDSAKFSFQYPATLQRKESTYGLGLTSLELQQVGTTTVSLYKMILIPKTIGKLINQDFDTYYNQQLNTETEIKEPTSEKISHFVKQNNRIIASQRAFDFISTSSSEQKESGTYIELGNNILIFTSAESQKAGLETIIQTLKYPL